MRNHDFVSGGLIVMLPLLPGWTNRDRHRSTHIHTHTHFCASICVSLYLCTFWNCLCWYLQFHSNTTEFIVLFSLSNCDTFPQQWKPTAVLVTRKFLILSVLNTQKGISELLTHTAEKNNSNKHSQFIYSSFCLQPEGIKSKYWVQKSNHFFSFLLSFFTFVMQLLIYNMQGLCLDAMLKFTSSLIWLIE